MRKKAPKASFAGKQNAINAIVDIALEILKECGSTLAHETSKNYYWHTVADAIDGLLDYLSPEETTISQAD
jgi:hypothetical protein